MREDWIKQHTKDDDDGTTVTVGGDDAKGGWDAETLVGAAV